MGSRRGQPNQNPQGRGLFRALYVFLLSALTGKHLGGEWEELTPDEFENREEPRREEADQLLAERIEMMKRGVAPFPAEDDAAAQTLAELNSGLYSDEAPTVDEIEGLDDSGIP